MKHPESRSRMTSREGFTLVELMVVVVIVVMVTLSMMVVMMMVIVAE